MPRPVRCRWSGAPASRRTAVVARAGRGRIGMGCPACEMPPGDGIDAHDDVAGRLRITLRSQRPATPGEENYTERLARRQHGQLHGEHRAARRAGPRRRSGRPGGSRWWPRWRAPGRCRRRASSGPARSGRTRVAGPRAARRAPRPRPPAGPTARSRRTRTRTSPPSGLWRTALSTRMVTTWRSRSASPDDHHRLRVDLDVDAPGARRATSWPTAASAATSPSSTGWRVRSSAPEVGARQQQQVLHERGQVADLGVDVVERGADLGDRLVLVQPQVLDAGAHDGQRRPQLVAGVGRELALSPERLALGVQRGPDGHQGARRVGGAEHARQHQRQDAATDQHLEQRLERVLLGGPVLDDLDDVSVAAAGSWRGYAQHARNG